MQWSVNRVNSRIIACHDDRTTINIILVIIIIIAS